MFKKIVAIIVATGMIATVLPRMALAGENADYVLELGRKSYITDLVGSEDGPKYHSGESLSENMNGAQIEAALTEFECDEIGDTLQSFEELTNYAHRNGQSEDYDSTGDFLVKLRQVWMEVKGCGEMISEDRDFIQGAYEVIENPDEHTTEREIEALACKIVEKADDLERQIKTAVEKYDGWVQVVEEAQARLAELSDDGTEHTLFDDSLQTQIVKLKTGRAEEIENISLKERSPEKDVVIDVVSMHEIRIYALDQNKQPLKNAVIYCWRADDSNPDRKKGEAYHPNDKGCVTLQTASLGADEDHYMTVGYEVSCPGYRTVFAEANYIKGAEIFWNYLEPNNPDEDVYVAGISLNGFDCKWTEKAMYITDENDAAQKVQLYLRSQSGKDFSGTATMKYAKRNASGEFAELSSDYSAAGGAATATFTGTFCRDIAENQQNAMSFSLSTSASNSEIFPSLKSEPARIDRTQYKQDANILNLMGMKQINVQWPQDLVFLKDLTVNIDLPAVLQEHVYLYTNCSGLWVAMGSTGRMPANVGKLEELNEKWKTTDTKKIDSMSKNAMGKLDGKIRNEVEKNFKRENYNKQKSSFLGGASFYFRGSFILYGTYDGKNPFNNTKITAVVGLQAGLRGDWEAQVFAGPVPVLVRFGFDLSASFFFKATKAGPAKNVDWNINFSPQLRGYFSAGIGVSWLGVGLRAVLTLRLMIPLLDTEQKYEKIFDFDVGLSIYLDVFFIHATFNIISGEGVKNITTGEYKFTRKAFWRNNQFDPMSLSDISDPAQNDDESEPKELNIDDEISGDTIWPYTPYSFTTAADALPVFYTLHWEGRASSTYTGDCDLMFWVDHEKEVRYRQTNYDEGSYSEFIMPSEVQKHLETREWRITGVRAAAHPMVYNITVQTPGQPLYLKAQVAAVTATIGTGWKEATIEQGDRKVVKEVPTGTVTVTRLFLYDGASPRQLQYIGSDGNRHDAVFINQTDVPISDAIGMVYDLNIINAPGAWYDDLVMEEDSKIVTFGTYAPLAVNEEPVGSVMQNTDMTVTEETAGAITEDAADVPEEEIVEEIPESSVVETAEPAQESMELSENTEEVPEEITESTADETQESAEEITGPAEDAVESSGETPEMTENGPETAAESLDEEWNGEDVNLDQAGIVYFTSTISAEDIVPKECRTRRSLPKGKPVKQLICGGGRFGSLLVQMEDSSLWAITADRARSYCISENQFMNNISDTAILRTEFAENDHSKYVLFFTQKVSQGNAGKQGSPLRSVVLNCNQNGVISTNGVVTDYDVDLKGAAFYAGNLLGENYLYWFENFKEKGTGENRTAVTAMCYSPKYNVFTSPYRLGVLNGSDGEAPSGYVSTGTPVSSYVMTDGNMIITKPWIAEGDEGEIDKDRILSVYKVKVVRRVAPDIMGAGTDLPAVSAGRNCNMLYTIVNKGNIPIVGFDFGIYHDGKLMQKSHLDLTDQSKNKVTFLNEGFSAVNPIVYDGEYSARRIGGLFDMINGDKWNISSYNINEGEAAESNGSTFVNVPALLPQGIHTYTMIFAVPESWEGDTKVTCKVEEAYVPKHTGDIFALSKNLGADEGDLADVQVLEVSEAETLTGPLEKGAGTDAAVAIAGTLNGFDEQNMESAGSVSLTDDYGRPMEFTYSPGFRDVEYDVVNLSLNCRVFDSDKGKQVTITVYQDGQTDNAAPQGVKIQAWLDYEEYPCFSYTFKNHHEDGRSAFSLTLPLEKLTGGRSGDVLTVGVSDTAKDNEEMSTIDDTCIIELNRSLFIISQPQDAAVEKGNDARFAVKVSGGEEPYHYQWQKFENNTWVDIENGNHDLLTVKETTLEMNGMLIRCVIEDSNGLYVTSRSVKLTVKEIGVNPDPQKDPENKKDKEADVSTGDDENPGVWVLLIISMAIVCSYLCILYKRKSR